MKLYLTADQIKSLENGIYESLMSNDEMGIGEMGDAREESERIVREWMEGNDIEESELETKGKEMYFDTAPTLKKENEELKATCKKYMNRAWNAEEENKRLSHLVKGLTETLENVLKIAKEGVK